MNGTDIFTTINPVIIKGLNDVINGFTHIGSNELKLAKFPVPKNPNRAKVSCKNSYLNGATVVGILFYVKKCTS